MVDNSVLHRVVSGANCRGRYTLKPGAQTSIRTGAICIHTSDQSHTSLETFAEGLLPGLPSNSIMFDYYKYDYFRVIAIGVMRHAGYRIKQQHNLSHCCGAFHQ